ncbi:MAG TPA: hypothetical protein VG275_07230 [Solirubrobacteraceae bacterium]|nr:hypothetical protein [Solirubrobacteraceae bacterium]
MTSLPHLSDSRTHFTPRGPRRSAADRAGLRRLEWRQLEQLVDGGGCWLTAKATSPAGAELSGQQASVGLRNLRARGLAEYTQDEWTHVGRWRATDEGTALVMGIRR